jgi:hypothetical protein
MSSLVRVSVEQQIKDRIFEHGRGWCFSAMHFLDLGSDASIRKALSNLAKEKMIRRLTIGVYDYPLIHETLGMIPPDLNQVAKAIAEKNGTNIQPAGAYSANLIGLSNQVPGRVIFLTEGPSRKVKIAGQEIAFRKVARKSMGSAGTRGGTLIQALKNLGKDHIDQTAKARVADFLGNCDKDEIISALRFAPAWIRKIVHEVMEMEKKND